MEKLEKITKLDLYTLEFYQCMIKDNKKRDFYRIVYYLYFLKKLDDNAFDNNYLKTKTGIIWPDNEHLMFQLVCLDSSKFQLDKDLLAKEEKELTRLIYDKYRVYSFTKLKELVNEDIYKLAMFEDLTLKEQLRLTIEKYQKLYDKNPAQAQSIVNDILKESSIIKKSNPNKKMIKLHKRVG